MIADTPKRRATLPHLKQGYRPLPRSFYAEDTFLLAPKVLGKLLIRRIGRKILAGRIVEVEAYVGDDPASHAARGMTERNKVMFESGGLAYVYFTYGMHYCFNIVTERKGYPAALLVRAVEPLAGIDEMKRRRKRDSIEELTNGPAKLCQAMGVDRALNGEPLDGERLFIARDEFTIKKEDIGVSKRIGISNGVDSEWRFYVKGNRFVSVFRNARLPESK